MYDFDAKLWSDTNKYLDRLENAEREYEAFIEDMEQLLKDYDMSASEAYNEGIIDIDQYNRYICSECV